MLHRRRPPKVQRHDLIPEIATPEKTVPNLDILVAQMGSTEIFATINRDSQIIQNPECHAAIEPGLRPITLSAFLRTEKQ
jgi:hypothetical protein